MDTCFRSSLPERRDALSDVIGSEGVTQRTATVRLVADTLKKGSTEHPTGQTSRHTRIRESTRCEHRRGTDQIAPAWPMRLSPPPASPCVCPASAPVCRCIRPPAGRSPRTPPAPTHRSCTPTPPTLNAHIQPHTHDNGMPVERNHMRDI